MRNDRLQALKDALANAAMTSKGFTVGGAKFTAHDARDALALIQESERAISVARDAAKAVERQAAPELRETLKALRLVIAGADGRAARKT